MSGIQKSVVSCSVAISMPLAVHVYHVFYHFNYTLCRRRVGATLPQACEIRAIRAYKHSTIKGNLVLRVRRTNKILCLRSKEYCDYVHKEYCDYVRDRCGHLCSILPYSKLIWDTLAANALKKCMYDSEAWSIMDIQQLTQKKESDVVGRKLFRTIHIR